MDYKRILWTSLLVLAAGILLLCYKLPSLEFFVSCLGYLFLASAVLNIVLQFVRARRHSDEAGRKSSGASVFGMLSAVASGALGRSRFHNRRSRPLVEGKDRGWA